MRLQSIKLHERQTISSNVPLYLDFDVDVSITYILTTKVTTIFIPPKLNS